MGKALLLFNNSSALNNLSWGTFVGTADNSTESDTRTNCTEAATFSNFRARIRSGNSGTATLTFLKGGVDTSQTFSIVGVGDGEDTVNSDALAASDLFNWRYNDTGTNSTFDWMAANVTFSSGHGNFHGAANSSGNVFDLESTTTFVSFNGDLRLDGQATEDNVEWKVRGYNSFEALQVRVLANARTNTSSFRNRINGADGSLLAEFAGGATGLVSDTSPADTITDGQTINASVTLGTGLEI